MYLSNVLLIFCVSTKWLIVKKKKKLPDLEASMGSNMQIPKTPTALRQDFQIKAAGIGKSIKGQTAANKRN